MRGRVCYPHAVLVGTAEERKLELPLTYVLAAKISEEEQKELICAALKGMVWPAVAPSAGCSLDEMETPSRFSCK